MKKLVVFILSLLLAQELKAQFYQNPTSGPSGTEVTITGSGFTNDLNTILLFNSNALTFVYVNSFTIIYIVPNIASGVYNVNAILNNTPNSILPQFTITPPPPIFTSVTPSIVGLNMEFTIAGFNFTNGISLYLTTGTNTSININVQSPTLMTASIANTYSGYGILPIYTGINGTINTGLNVNLIQRPIVSNIFPATVTSDNFITLTGNNFASVTGVVLVNKYTNTRFNAGFTLLSNTSIRTFVPFDLDYALYTTNVFVNTVQSSDTIKSFRHIKPNIVLNSVNPSPAAIGEEFTIAGSGLYSTQTVSLNGIPISFNKINGNILKSIIPSNVQPGSYTLSLSNNTLNSTNFSVIVQNAIQSVSISSLNNKLALTSTIDSILLVANITPLTQGIKLRDLIWTIFPGYGTVTPKGVVKVSQSGIFTITGTSLQSPFLKSFIIITASGMYTPARDLSIFAPNMVRQLNPSNNNMVFQSLVLPIEATNKKVKWSISPSSLAQIDTLGKLSLATETQNGTITITGISDDNPNLKSNYIMNIVGKTITVGGITISTKSTDAFEPNPCKQTLLLSIPNNYSKYQWFIDKLKLVGATTSSIKPVFEGNYEVVVIDTIVRRFPSFSINKLGTKPTLGFKSGNDSILVVQNSGKYKWLLNNRLINGASSNNLKILLNGIYSVVVTDTNGCKLVSEGVLIKKDFLPNFRRNEISDSDSVIYDYFGDKPQIEFYPNPAKDFINIMISKSFEEGKVIIFNLLGEQLISVSINQKSISLPIQNWQKGIYVLEIIIDGVKERRKFSVMN